MTYRPRAVLAMAELEPGVWRVFRWTDGRVLTPPGDMYAPPQAVVWGPGSSEAAHRWLDGRTDAYAVVALAAMHEPMRRALEAALNGGTDA